MTYFGVHLAFIYPNGSDVLSFRRLRFKNDTIRLVFGLANQMHTSVHLLAFHLVLCTHDNCLFILLTQDHVCYLFKIHLLRGTIIKCNTPNFTDGLAFASR